MKKIKQLENCFISLVLKHKIQAELLIMLLIIMWGLHALYQYSSFVPQSKDQSQKLTVGVNVSVNGYRSLCVNPVKDW